MSADDLFGPYQKLDFGTKFHSFPRHLGKNNALAQPKLPEGPAEQHPRLKN